MKFILSLLGGFATGASIIMMASFVYAADEAVVVPAPELQSEMVLVKKDELIYFMMILQGAVQEINSLAAENAQMKKQLEVLSVPKECV